MQEATERYFRGRWQMMRIIENVDEGIIGEFWGEARFMPEALVRAREEGRANGTHAVAAGASDALDCHELGVLRFRGQDFHAERRSVWAFPREGEVAVRYTDGRPFHAFPVHDPVAEHLCGEDRYRVSYTFGDGNWSSIWEVSGPRKDYRMSTRYRRLGSRMPVPMHGWPAAGMTAVGEGEGI